ncbi:MAG: hypothetical protein P0Y65_12270 [Candidatus Devosia phytovorans]|uniref:Uncharacterized protein n=1 Tax=Candidatus Devosia phytovorans TaxID=3121372 RepID=A0AAJ5VRM9_9HYPH|nr:hypothetical protein [Devosia sp.]WEK02982.1 MAG: hypothetical protein P0Y65_12270 [Devosia sp.]
MGLLRDFLSALNRTPEENHAEIEQMYPGYLAKLDAARKRDTAAAAREASLIAHRKSGSAMSETAEAAHQMAMRGAIDPKVAFSMGVPGAPDGTGKLVGPGGHYKG